jgi:hypothetical protein
MKPHHCPKKSCRRRSAEPEASTRAGSQAEEESLEVKTSHRVVELFDKRANTWGKWVACRKSG